MAFPLNPLSGDSHTIGSRTWYWDGSAWNLLPSSRADGTDHDHDTPKILDHLLDVEIEEPAYSVQYNFYINTSANELEDSNVQNGWGRYSVHTTDKTISFHKNDLDGKEMEILYDFTNPDITTHKFAAFDESYAGEAKVVKKEETAFGYTFTYDSSEVVNLVNNGGMSKLFGLIAADYKKLSDGAILVYRQRNELWKPEPNPELETGNKITLSATPPENSNAGDVWVDEKDFYMYLWEPNTWIALTGPESGNGGGDIAFNRQINMISSRGLAFDDNRANAAFRLNQDYDQQIDVIQKNITTLGYTPHDAPEKSDIWIDQQTYHQYAWDGNYWIGITGDDSYFPAANNRLEQPCRLIGGKPNSVYCHDDGNSTIPSPVHISVYPPEYPRAGDLWFDSEHLEMRVWYVTGTSFGGWVSNTHPGMRPDLKKAPEPQAITLTGPAIAQELQESGRYYAITSWKILEEIDKVPGASYPKVQWASSDTDAKFYYKDELQTIATIKFSRFGNFSVTSTITYYNNPEEQDYTITASDTKRTSVTIIPPGDPIRYQVKVVDGGVKGPIFQIDGDNQPHLNLMRNRKYIFDQTHPSNEGYLFRFYDATVYDDGEVLLDVIGDEFITGVEQIRKEVHITVPPNAPIRLAYGSPVNNAMGWWIYPFDVDGSVNLIDPTTIES